MFGWLCMEVGVCVCVCRSHLASTSPTVHVSHHVLGTLGSCNRSPPMEKNQADNHASQPP